MSDHNDLSELQSALALALHDPDYETWGATEGEDLVTWSVAQLWPRYGRAINAQDATGLITILDGSYFYLLDESFRAISRVDLLGADGTEYGPLFGRSWELSGSLEDGEGLLHVSPSINDAHVGGTFRLVGYGIYDLYDHLVPNRLVPLVLARARAEAYRRVGGDRLRFEGWLARNQTQNASVNELTQLINEADAEIARLTRDTQRTWQRPVPGHQG
jgi:hypothetical protein